MFFLLTEQNVQILGSLVSSLIRGSPLASLAIDPGIRLALVSWLSTVFAIGDQRRGSVPYPAALGPEDQGNGTLQITDLTPIQVIKSVDLVKGKRTLVRTTLDFNTGTDNATHQATAKAYLGGQFQQENTIITRA